MNQVEIQLDEIDTSWFGKHAMLFDSFPQLAQSESSWGCRSASLGAATALIFQAWVPGWLAYYRKYVHILKALLVVLLSFLSCLSTIDYLSVSCSMLVGLISPSVYYSTMETGKKNDEKSSEERSKRSSKKSVVCKSRASRFVGLVTLRSSAYTLTSLSCSWAAKKTAN